MSVFLPADDVAVLLILKSPALHVGLTVECTNRLHLLAESGIIPWHANGLHNYSWLLTQITTNVLFAQTVKEAITLTSSVSPSRFWGSALN